MKDFNHYLNTIGEIGYVDVIMNSVAYVSGLPKATENEVLLFESGGKGFVLGMTEDFLEVLILNIVDLKVGTKVARTGEVLDVKLSPELLGKRLNGLGEVLNSTEIKEEETRPIDVPPAPIIKRKKITKPLDTGVSVVDLVVPIAKGQRELIIGDRSTGKTSFLHQVILNQARKETICIYVAIAKKRVSIKRLQEYFAKSGILDKTIIIASSAAENAGLVYITPYVGMTIAEYFKDKGFDVLIVLDDMTTHAMYYREVSLLIRRFPGRNSYPGDIFYIHSRLLERAGNFEKGSITALPVAETVLGDLSGYIQTNLMSMTDGHIYFDSDFMNQGKFPPVNPFLSVTRVGLQAQTPLIKDTSRSLTTFLVSYDRLRQYMHFGAELTQNVRSVLDFGQKIEAFFSQSSQDLIPVNLSVFFLACIWANVWKDISLDDLQKKSTDFLKNYTVNPTFTKKVNEIVDKSQTLDALVLYIKQNQDQLFAS